MYDGSTALILAARLAVEGMVEELITCHADVNAVDELGECVCERVCVCVRACVCVCESVCEHVGSL